MMKELRSIFYDRKDLEFISGLVERNTSVLDLGCGDGSLLKKLKEEKNVTATGVDISEENIISCITKGISVFQSNLDDGLADYSDQSFDYVILAQTLQAVRKPRMILNEALRVGHRAVVSIPNFGYWQVRIQLSFTGKMPKLEFLPYEWYETPNIRLLTINDFRDLCKKDHIVIEKEIYTNLRGKTDSWLSQTWPNLFAQAAIFLVSKEKK